MASPSYPVRDWFPLVFYGDATADLHHRITSDILAHPHELPSRTELEYTLTTPAAGDWSPADIHDALDRLQTAGLVTELATDDYVFYGLTDDGRQFLTDAGSVAGSSVMKAVTTRLERPPPVEAAYTASRPDHPPATQSYTQQDWSDSDAWTEGWLNAYRTLELSYERTAATTFEIQLVAVDAKPPLDDVTAPDTTDLATKTLQVDAVDDTITEDYASLTVPEPRGEAGDPADYGVYVDHSDLGTYSLQPSRDGGPWYSNFIRRDLHIFAPHTA